MYASGVCADCPVGHKCPTVGATSPETCPNGYYTSSVRQADCTICEAGRSCVSKTNSTECPRGYYSPQGEMYCLMCGSGNYR